MERRQGCHHFYLPLMSFPNPLHSGLSSHSRTMRDAEAVQPDDPTPPAGGGDGPVVILPKGYEPGWFGKVEGAGLHVKVGPTGTENSS